MLKVELPHDSLGEATGDNKAAGMILQAEPEPYLVDHVTPTQAVWSAAGFVAAVTVVLCTCLIIYTCRRWDRTGGMLTLSILIVQGFITGTYGAMLYEIRQNPITEILVGALATSMGAVVAHWSGGPRRHQWREMENTTTPPAADAFYRDAEEEDNGRTD